MECGPERSPVHTTSTTVFREGTTTLPYLDGLRDKPMSRPSVPTFNHEGDVADTAFVAAGVRARETERGSPLFLDPLASLLAGDRGRRMAGRPHSRLFFHGVIARTAVLDEFIGQTVNRDGARSVVNLGAGLDTRPYRLILPANLRWVEADLPRIVDYKSTVLDGARPRCQLERLSVDLTDAAAREVLLDRLSGSGPTLIVSEGLVTYLREDEVAELARDLATGTTVEWWALDLVGSPWFLSWANWFPRRRSSRANTRLQFAPRDGADFFRPLGWEPVDVRFSWPEQRRLGCEPRLMRAARAVSPPRLQQHLEKASVFVLLKREERR
jgi:methyltransferase (TIGR00027 family)